MRSAERAIPGISDSVIYSESATPITHERFVRSTGGTSYGLAATPDQMLLKRPSARTAIKGLWIVGASTRYMHGISGTLGGGMLTAASIADVPVSQLRRLRLPDVWRPSRSSTFRSAPPETERGTPARMTRTGFHSVTKPGRLHARRHWRIRASR